MAAFLLWHSQCLPYNVMLRVKAATFIVVGHRLEIKAYMLYFVTAIML